MKITPTILLLPWLLLGVDADYFGYPVGNLRLYQHRVNGSVYIVNSTAIRIVNFTYDGQGPDAFFYIGLKGQTERVDGADSNGVIIADENGGSDPLGAYDTADIVLELPVNVTDVVWLSVWCRQFSVNFGDVVFPTTIRVPAPSDIGQFPTFAHGLRSRQVTVLDAKTFYIRDLHYDGYGPDAFFLVNTGDVTHIGSTKVPDENGSLLKLNRYTGQTITIRLPGSLTVYDIDWISIYCIAFRQDFGHIRIPDISVPPVLPEKQTEEGDIPGCMHLHDYLNVGWTVSGDQAYFEFVGALDAEGGYMAFGLSGSDAASSMFGADVYVAYFDESMNTVKVDDYTLTAYSMCSRGEGACPDTARTGGVHDIRVLSSSRRDGIVTVRFQRPLVTADSGNDKAIVTDRDVYAVWALGRLTSAQPYQVTKHDIRLQGDLKVNFGQTTSESCTAVEPRVSVEVEPWQIRNISAANSTTFNVTIGPAGGDKGYTAITGRQSWGIAFYINGVLIPELYLTRHQTYTFIVETGDDAALSARYHPFYITNDSIGGFGKKSAEEKVNVVNYLGVNEDGSPSNGSAGRYCEYEPTSTEDPSTFDTFEAFFQTLRLNCQGGEPGLLSWTPDESTPSELYYQCWAHNYLGWKIHIVDDQSSDVTTSRATSPEVTDGIETTARYIAQTTETSNETPNETSTETPNETPNETLSSDQTTQGTRDISTVLLRETSPYISSSSLLLPSLTPIVTALFLGTLFTINRNL